MMPMAKFSNWITGKFLEWQAKQGKRKTLDEFAAYLGVSRPLLNMWMNGDKPRPGQANIKMLSEVFGDEIYDVLDLPRPDPFMLYVQKTSPNLKDNQKKKISEQIAKYITTNEKESPAH